MDTVFKTIREDASVPNNVHELYSSELLTLIQTDWNIIRCSIMQDASLPCNEASFRFAKNAPNTQKNYVPVVMGEHTNLMRFFTTILRNKYAYTPVLVNFSACFASVSESLVRLVYASRYNFQCLPTSFLIHDGASLNAFENILKNYNFAEYVQNTTGPIASLYSGGIFPLGLSMHFTKVNNRIWGNDASKSHPLHRGLSSACCKTNASSTTDASNLCLFKCILTHFFVDGQNCLKNMANPKKGRT